MNARETQRRLANVLAVFSVLLGVFVAFSSGLYWGLAAGVLSIAGTVGILTMRRNHVRSLCSPDCVDVDRAVAYVGWRASVHEFEIRSQRFAKEFLVANRKKLVNLSPEAMSLLASSGKGIGRAVGGTARRYLG